MTRSLLAGASLALLVSIGACSPAKPLMESVAVAEPAAAPAAPTPISIAAPSGDYVSDVNHSSITFKLQHLGLSHYTMRFRTFDATVSFDPANIPASKVVAKVKPTDILVGFPGDYVRNHPGTRFTSWEGDLANSSNFLNTERFPEISFASTAVEVTGERTAKVTGDLTLLGVTKLISLDVTFSGETDAHPFAKVPAIGLSATGSFKRSDFGLTYLSQGGMVGDVVEMSIEGDFIEKVAAPS
ncbi:MAG: YceI family protein [Hyphomonadaceae bacterium]|nr:YceI family protein [Hyphomonadaceae bacterium]